MGQQNSYQAGLNTSLTLVQQLPIGKVFKEQQSQTLYFIKEYAYTSEEAFQQAFLKFSSKLTTKSDNVLNLQKANTKIDNTFCSTFYKIVLVFEYVNYSLADEIVARNKENRAFQEKQIWSVLFHCTLGISHLKRTEGVQHSAISLKDIKLAEDGTIKIIPTQMVGIYNQHDQNSGTTKKLAMSILGCILTKQVSNQSTEYLEALIEKTKCSKQLKKALYLMIMEDTTFQELQEYLFRLANDENDTLLSGVSTPVYSSHKKISRQETIVKKLSQELIQTQTNGPLHSLGHQKEDIAQVNILFETFQLQNPDQNDDDNDIDRTLGSTEHHHDQEQITIHLSNETQTFSSEGNIHIDYKIKEHSIKQSSFEKHEDATVRLMARRQSNVPNFVHQPLNCEVPPVKSQNLYTDPKLLDLIKKDLEEIQQKSRISFGGKEDSHTRERNQTMQQQGKWQFENSSSFKRPSLYNISTLDFNMRPPTSIENQPSSLTQIKEPQGQNPQGNKETRMQKKLQQSVSKTDEMFKEIDNLPRRSKEQQSFGNILDQDASFKKAKPKKSLTTINEQQNKRDLHKENIYQSKQTNRVVQSYKNTENILSNKPKLTEITQPNKPKLTQTKLSPQPVPQQQSPPMQLVSQTYQKGEYKGYKKNGLRHGHGTFYYKEGGHYIGEWKQNKMTGKGTLFYPNDQIAYEGNWKDDQLHGYGTLYNEEVMQLERSFDYQDWAMVEEYWVKYEGEFSMDNKHGKGKLYLSNGEVFEGHFKEDMIDGEGVLNRQNGSRIKGIWRKNKLLRMY